MVKEVNGLVQKDYCTRYIICRRNEIRNYYNNLGNSYPKTFDILTEYAIAEPNGFNCCATHSVVTTNNELFVVNERAQTITNNKVKLNGQECNTFVEAIPIAYRYQMLNTARKVFPHQITMHKDGFYYFSHFSALNNIDYQTKITVGGFARAYLQQDETVNVYINKGDTIYKYVLAKDQDQKYQVSSATEFCKGLKYIEGMNGAGFLFDREGNVSLLGVQAQIPETAE